MNERIKLLIEQSYDTVEYNYAPSKEFFNKQKFAELIVQECAKSAYKYAADSKNYAYYNDVGWDCLPSDLQSHINEHFGVEE